MNDIQDKAETLYWQIRRGREACERHERRIRLLLAILVAGACLLAFHAWWTQ